VGSWLPLLNKSSLRGAKRRGNPEEQVYGTEDSVRWIASANASQ
jgi:hypothetical protein